MLRHYMSLDGLRGTLWPIEGAHRLAWAVLASFVNSFVRISNSTPAASVCSLLGTFDDGRHNRVATRNVISYPSCTHIQSRDRESFELTMA
jgi:hypothetical protein